MNSSTTNASRGANRLPLARPRLESTDRPPRLPFTLIDMILAHVAHLPADTLDAPVPFVTVISVLPPSVIPTAVCTAIVRSSSLAHLAPFDSALDKLASSLHDGDHGHASRFLNLIHPALISNPSQPDSALQRLVAAACRTASLPVLNWLNESRGIDLAVCTMALDEAAKLNKVDVLEWWIQDFNSSPVPILSEDALLDAARNGHLDVLQWAARTHLCAADFDSGDVVSAISTHGHLAILKWLEAVSDLDNDYFDPNEWLTVSRHGHAHVLEWALVERGMDLPEDLQCCIDAAAGNGHTAVLDWFFANAPRAGFRYSVQALDVASRNGHMATLEWFLRSGFELKYTPRAVEDARNLGRAAVVQWWMSSRFYLSVLTGRTSHHRPPTDFAMLAAFGYPIGPDQASELDTLSARQVQDVIGAACRHGHVHVLAAFKSRLSRARNRTLLHSEAIRGNSLAVLKWFSLEDHARWNPFHANLDDALIDAAASGHAQAVHFVFASRYLGKPALDEQSRELLHKGIVAACTRGRTSVLDLLHSLPWFNPCLSSCGSESALTAAAVSGHIGVLEWWQSHQLPFPQCAAKIIDQVSVGEAKHAWLILEWWAGRQRRSFAFTDMALWGAIKAKRLQVLRWWIRTGFVTGPLMLAALEGASESLEAGRV